MVQYRLYSIGYFFLYFIPVELCVHTVTLAVCLCRAQHNAVLAHEPGLFWVLWGQEYIVSMLKLVCIHKKSDPELGEKDLCGTWCDPLPQK